MTQPPAVIAGATPTPAMGGISRNTLTGWAE